MTEQRDKEFLRRAIALSEEAVASGGRPFGAVICDGEGQIVAEARSVAPVDPRDWTAHSEIQALRAASAAMSWESLGHATIDASGEPCPMCAAAIYWCNIRRLVFSVSEPAMRSLREPYERAAGIAMRCEEIFARCGRRVDVIGPLIEHEGLPVHRLFWPNARADVKLGADRTIDYTREKSGAGTTPVTTFHLCARFQAGDPLSCCRKPTPSTTTCRSISLLATRHRSFGKASGIPLINSILKERMAIPVGRRS
jgi:tRNA(Arg) A34 adenosine deaminase TadA